MQSLNKKYGKRQQKIEFVRNCINDNRIDMIYLIDVNDDLDCLVVNGYTKYSDKRNILFVKNNICNKFEVYNSTIMDKRSKIAFMYITPATNDKILLNNFEYFLENEYLIVGDVNLKSNPQLMKLVDNFEGEDSLQTGFIGRKVLKNYNIAGPSDHYAIFAQCKLKLETRYNLKLVSIDMEDTYNNVNQIIHGIVPKFEPKIVINKGYIGLNDRESTINDMVNDYLRNKVHKTFKRYNFLWKFNRKEPFLGTRVPVKVQETFAQHLKADDGKQYKDIKAVDNIKYSFTEVKKTRSNAVNYECMTLNGITDTLSLIINKNNKCVEEEKIDLIGNIIKVANKMKDRIVAKTFFLEKNKKLCDFNDVRVIVVMPTVLKMFEALIYDDVASYFAKYFGKGEEYQFGGLSGGSTYKAMMNLRLQIDRMRSGSIMLMDMSKGYDSVRIDILEDLIKGLENEKVKYLLEIWITMVANLDYVVNGERLKRKRGLAMGLSLSPIMFIFYLHNAMRDISKSNISCYIDDIGLVIAENDVEGARKMVMDLIGALDSFDLVINQKKTVVISNNAEVIKEFEKDFPIVNADKYLGRAIGVNGDGRIMADDRFYGLKMFRSYACPYWATFGIKRLVFNGAIDASMRYRFFMWSATTKVVRTAIWRNSWSFFKRSFGKFSYFQLSFCAFNYFRYCIDVVDIKNWMEQLNKGRSRAVLAIEVLSKISVDQDQLQDAINAIKINWSILEDRQRSLFDITKRFTNKIFKDLRSNLVNIYLRKKRLEGKRVFPYIGKFMTSKVFKNFGFIHNIVFLFSEPKRRAKQIVAYNLLKNVGECVDFCYKEIMRGNIVEFDLGKLWGKRMEDFAMINWAGMDKNDWDTWLGDKYVLLWPLVIVILNLCNKIDRNKAANDDMEDYHIEENEAIVCCDGSFNERLNCYGYGGFIEFNGNRKEFSCRGTKEEFRKYKNIAGELEGVIHGLKMAVNAGCTKINVLYDCKCIEEYANGNWKVHDNEVAKWYKEQLLDLYSKNKVHIRWTHLTSHTGVVENELADQLAKKAVGIIDNKDGANKNNNTLSKTKMDALKAVYKMMFKVFAAGEMIFYNYNLTDFGPEELWLNLRVKVCNMDEFTDKIYNVMEFEEKDVDSKEFYE